jgi:hypothetical protein
MAADAQTKVTQDAKCAVTIVVPIEVYGPLAKPEVINRFKKNIEAAWNGATQEMIDQIATHADINPTPINVVDNNGNVIGQENQYTTADAAKLNKLYQDFLKSIGVEGACAIVNCCKICVKVDIRVRKPGQPDPHYHQIEIVPNGFVRSYVRGTATAMETPASGQWENDPTDFWPPEAHEVGHLMTLDDQYQDGHDAQGTSTGSVAKKGHANDLMAHLHSWPQQSAYEEILKKAGLTINCCEDPKGISEITNVAINLANDMIKSCNRDEIQKMILDLEARRAAIVAENISLTVKYELVQGLDAAKGRLEKALLDCPPPVQETFTVYTAFDGTIWCTFGDGIPIPMTLIPSDPFGNPLTPDGTPITPGQPKTPKTASSTPTVPQTPKSSSTPQTPKTPKTPETPKTTSKKPETPKTTDTPPTTDTVFAKVRESVLQGGQSGNAVQTQVVRLTPKQKPDVPADDAAKATQDTAFNKSPVQCSPGADGQCEMKVPADERATYELGSEDKPSSNYRLDVATPNRSGGLVKASANQPAPDFKKGAPPGANVTARPVKIGNDTYYRLDISLDGGVTWNYSATWNQLFGPNIYETDVCREKQPGLPLGLDPVSFSAINQSILSSSVTLRANLRAGPHRLGRSR